MRIVSRPGPLCLPVLLLFVAMLFCASCQQELAMEYDQSGGMEGSLPFAIPRKGDADSDPSSAAVAEPMSPPGVDSQTEAPLLQPPELPPPPAPLASSAPPLMALSALDGKADRRQATTDPSQDREKFMFLALCTQSVDKTTAAMTQFAAQDPAAFSAQCTPAESELCVAVAAKGAGIAKTISTKVQTMSSSKVDVCLDIRPVTAGLPDPTKQLENLGAPSPPGALPNFGAITSVDTNFGKNPLASFDPFGGTRQDGQYIAPEPERAENLHSVIEFLQLHASVAEPTAAVALSSPTTLAPTPTDIEPTFDYPPSPSPSSQQQQQQQQPAPQLGPSAGASESVRASADVDASAVPSATAADTEALSPQKETASAQGGAAPPVDPTTPEPLPETISAAPETIPAAPETIPAAPETGTVHAAPEHTGTTAGTPPSPAAPRMEGGPQYTITVPTTPTIEGWPRQPASALQPAHAVAPALSAPRLHFRQQLVSLRCRPCFLAYTHVRVLAEAEVVRVLTAQICVPMQSDLQKAKASNDAKASQTGGRPAPADVETSNNLKLDQYRLDHFCRSDTLHVVAGALVSLNDYDQCEACRSGSSAVASLVGLAGMTVQDAMNWKVTVPGETAEGEAAN
eukprot:gnl/Spiro4/18716_TR9998_c0_g1_i1.p1 gnl/Spiro4/18716_TR9998_c0_g1~~gnl/Spiro4/18716_TR9998_c0_g1_i1.p1  ORF type:complete len:628 (+),score=166.23 gnl/Spiro4/18716_TR9998_c0_g1_i1:116-1999(+)